MVLTTGLRSSYPAPLAKTSLQLMAIPLLQPPSAGGSRVLPASAVTTLRSPPPPPLDRHVRLLTKVPGLALLFCLDCPQLIKATKPIGAARPPWPRFPQPHPGHSLRSRQGRAMAESTPLRRGSQKRPVHRFQSPRGGRNAQGSGHPRAALARCIRIQLPGGPATRAGLLQTQVPAGIASLSDGSTWPDYNSQEAPRLEPASSFWPRPRSSWWET